MRAMNTQEAIDFAESVEGIYTREELVALYDLADGLPNGARVLEIGVLYGRSTSALMILAKRKHFDLRLVDPFVLNGPDAAAGFARLAADMQCPFVLYCMRSDEVRWVPGMKIDLLHVDGDHSPEGIKRDCQFLQFVKRNGYAVFHDYGNPDYPQVKQIVDHACEGWLNVGVTGQQARFMNKCGY